MQTGARAHVCVCVCVCVAPQTMQQRDKNLSLPRAKCSVAVSYGNTPTSTFRASVSVCCLAHVLRGFNSTQRITTLTLIISELIGRKITTK